jgi:hypothetical protein
VETLEMTAGVLAALREAHERELLEAGEAADQLARRELLEEAEAMDKEDAIPPGGFWQRLDIECETIGDG